MALHRMREGEVTDAPDFRAVGFTDAAAQYPKDELAKIALAAWLNVPVEKLPVAMHYHPNSSTMEAWGRVGEAIAAWNRRAEPVNGQEADTFDTLIAEAKVEAAKAMRKFPQPNYVISKVAEEAGEVVKAAIHCAEGRETRDAVVGEMRQTIAMLYRLWVEGDQVHGLRALATDRMRGDGDAD